MVSQTAFQLTLDFLTSKPVVVVPSADQVSSDAGLLPFRQLDERLGLTRQFAEALTDRRHAGYVDHPFLEMTRMRVYGILADYADQNDHDVLRSDPIFKLLCDRSLADDDLASQPTLSRFENAIDVRSLLPAPRHLARPVHRLLQEAAAAVDTRHRSLRRSHPRSATVDVLPRLLRAVPVFAARHHLCGERLGRCRFVCCTARLMQPWEPRTICSMSCVVCARRGRTCMSIFAATAASARPRCTRLASNWTSNTPSASA